MIPPMRASFRFNFAPFKLQGTENPAITIDEHALKCRPSSNSRSIVLILNVFAVKRVPGHSERMRYKSMHDPTRLPPELPCIRPRKMICGGF
jgi:hypothetical protein